MQKRVNFVQKRTSSWPYRLTYAPFRFLEDPSVQPFHMNADSPNPAVIDELHYHDGLELGLCLDGSGVFIIDGEPIPFSAPCVTILYPGQYHKARSGLLPSRWYFATFCPELLLPDLGAKTSRELFNGSTATAFHPAGTTNRQQVWMILARLNGSTPADMAAARTWAVDNGVSDGSNPTGTMSRQQLAAMLYRYAQSKGLGFTGQWAYHLDYPDTDQVAGYAYEAMCWMTMHGIINGTAQGTLDPQGPATRAQVAVILQRFVEVMYR